MRRSMQLKVISEIHVSKKGLLLRNCYGQVWVGCSIPDIKAFNSIQYSLKIKKIAIMVSFIPILLLKLLHKANLPNFISLCCKLIIIHYHTPKQREIKFKPRIKLNHNIYSHLSMLQEIFQVRDICASTTVMQ